MIYFCSSFTVPSMSPSNITCKEWSSQKLIIEWSQIDDSKWHGFMGGYIAFYKLYETTGSWSNVTAHSVAKQITIENLKPYTRYEIELAAFTGKGLGPSAWIQCRTLESGKNFNQSTIYCSSFIDQVPIFHY